MISLDLETLPTIAKLLAPEGWVICEYKVLGENQVYLKIVRKEKKSESNSVSDT